MPASTAKHPRDAPEGNVPIMGPIPPGPPRDFNVQRYRNERTPEDTPYVKVEDFNNTVWMAFTRAITVKVSKGTKDR